MTDSKDLIRGHIELRVGTRRERIRAELPREAVGLESILPAARQMTEAVVSWAVADTESTGRRISCRAGCGGSAKCPSPGARGSCSDSSRRPVGQPTIPTAVSAATLALQTLAEPLFLVRQHRGRPAGDRPPYPAN
jgi:hypothetical protein